MFEIIRPSPYVCWSNKRWRGADKLNIYAWYFRTRNCTFKMWHSEFENCKIALANSCALFEGNRETDGLPWIKMISILPWLRAMFRHGPASSSRHMSKMASFVRSWKNTTTSACIRCVVPAYFHLFLVPI
jgi:hypothetical protein